MCQGAVDRAAGDLASEAAFQSIAEPSQAAFFGLDLLSGDLESAGESHCAGKVGGSGAQPALVPASADRRLEPYRWFCAANVEPTDALGCIQLVTGKGEKIDLEHMDIDRQLANPLGRITVKQCTPPASHPCGVTNRLHRTGFVVGEHQADQHRICAEGLVELVESDAPVPVDPDLGQLPAAVPQLAEGLED